jgi:hypothetical protein
MPQISLDYIHYHNEPLQEYVAIVSSPNQQYLALRLSKQSDEKSIQHHKYIITHDESIKIVSRIKEKFTEIAHIQFQNDLDNYFNFDPSQLEFVKYMSLAPLQEIRDFHGLNIQEYKLAIVVSNNYHLNGQLEIALVYTHPLLDKTFTVFDKWSAADNKNLFRDVTNRINPMHDNFNRRDILIELIAQSVYGQFIEALGNLHKFILIASEVPIEEQTIIPVLLDLKNMNRSRTSIIANKGRGEKIKAEISTYDYRIYQMSRQNNQFTYLDFLLLISFKQYSSNNFKKLQEDLTASKIYKDLLTTVQSFRNEMQKIEYEREQLQSYNNISNLIRI